MIIDNDLTARRHLRNRLESVPDTRIISEVSSVEDALTALEHIRPQMVFIEIEIPGASEPSFTRRLVTNAVVVWATRNKARAFEAWSAYVEDFLLKPVTEKDLTRAVKRGLLKWQNFHVQPRALPTCGLQDVPSRIIISDGDRTRFFDIRDVVRFFENDAGQTVFFAGGRKHMAGLTLDEVEKQFTKFGFLRTHRQELLNLRHVVEISHREGEQVTALLRDGQTAAVGPEGFERITHGLSLLPTKD